MLGFGRVDPEVVYLDTWVRTEIVQRDSMVRAVNAAFDQLWQASLDRTQTKHLLRAVIAQYESGRYPRPWSL